MQRFLSAFILILALSAQALGSSDPTRGWSRSKVDLRRFMMPPRDQGGRNTSAAFAATALMEFLLRSEKDESIVLSAEWAYTQGRALVRNSPLSGYYRTKDDLPGYSAVLSFEMGSINESDWPYQKTPPTDRMSYSLPERLSFLPYRLRPEWIPLENAGNFLLQENRPIVITLWWYPANITSTGKVVPPTKNQRADCAEGRGGCFPHTVLLVGYKKNSRTFLFRNSKGEDWGENGYGTLTEDTLLKDALGNYGDWNSVPQDGIEFLKMGMSGKLIEIVPANSKAIQRLPQ